MNIEFTLKNKERYLLTADENNYQICRLKITENALTGEKAEGWVPFKFFGSIAQALNRIMDMKLRASDAKDLKQLMIDLLEIRKEITSVWSTNLQTV